MLPSRDNRITSAHQIMKIGGTPTAMPVTRGFLAAILIVFMSISPLQCCLPSFQPMYSYNPPPFYPASYGVPFKARHSGTGSSSDNTLASSDTPDSCSTRFDNSKLTCATPFLRQNVLGEIECQRICFENIVRCHSFEYTLFTGQCDLYAVEPPAQLTDFLPRPRAVAADDPIEKKHTDFSYRAKRQFENGVDSFGQNCVPEILPAMGTAFYVPNLDCAGQVPFNMEPTQEAIEPFAARQRQPSSHSLSSLPSSSGEAVASVAHSFNTGDSSTDCRDGGRARIQLVDGIAITPGLKEPVAKVQVESADVCLLLCRNNAYLDGQKFSRPCVSTSFDRSTGRCTIMDDSITPNGQLQYTPQTDSIYFEKLCIPLNELSNSCDDLIHRIPQRVLNSPADATLDAHSQVECLRRCITAHRSLGFVCQSAAYYFDFPNQNCILNRFTRVTKPESFTAELQQMVDYMELAPCMIGGGGGGSFKKDAPMQETVAVWSEWSECSAALTRSRKRNCTDCGATEETAPCIRSNTFQHEFPTLTNKIESDLVAIPKNMASGFDTAAPKQQSQERHESSSFLTESDYDTPREVNYFGPPRTTDLRAEIEAKNALFGNRRVPDISKTADGGQDVIRNLESDDTRSQFFKVAPAETFELPRTGGSSIGMGGMGVGIVEFAPHKAVEGHSTTTTTTKKPPVTTDAANCDPHRDCCPLVDMSGRKTRGCTLGFRINSKNQQEGCVPESCRIKFAL